MGELVEFASDGSTARGYVAPARGGAGPGILVVHESWGLVPHIQDVCSRFADEGFTALAPDLFRGRTISRSKPDEAAEAMATLDVESAAGDLSGAIELLVAHPEVRGHGVGVVGFGMGAGLALWLAGLRPDQVRATVPFYGAIPWPEAQPDWDRVASPVEAHYGEEDGWATPELARSFEKELLDRGKEVRLFTYPGAAHAFFDDTRPDAHEPEAARQAWVRTLEFLRAKLG